MIGAVLDTNVLISSFLQPAGVPSQVRHAWQQGLFGLCLSNPLFDELREVLSRPVITRSTKVRPEEIELFLKYLASAAYFVSEPLQIERVIAQDPDDGVVLATALAGQAQVVVSGDQHLLTLVNYRGISIVTPRQFLELIAGLTS